MTRLITNLLHDQQSAETIAVVLIALATLLVILACLLLFNNHLDPARLRFLQGNINNDELSSPQNEINNTYLKYSQMLLPSNEQLLHRTKARLNHAGFHYRKHVYQYFAIRILLIVTLPSLVLFFVQLMPTIKFDEILKALLLSAILGYILPSFVLDRLIKNRQKTIHRAFPDALDLLVVCTEAGLSLDAAIQKVAEEISFSHPVLAQELNIVIAELRAGVERKKALDGLADRTGVEAIRGLMSSINQSMRFGSSISETLRVYSEDFRDMRMQAAEEKAAKIGIKLLLPTALCLLPCFLLIVLVPTGLNLINAFKNFQ
ncbi:MAG: type II secretion system F family protein [Methylococcales bacterium]